MTKDSDKHTDEWLSSLPHITHDFRTPLVTIGLESGVFEEWMPELIKGYRLAVEHQLMEGSIKERQISLQLEGGMSIKSSVTKLSDWLRVLDEGVKALSLDISTLEPRSIQSYLDDLLARYPFESDAERHKIQLTIASNFNVPCAPFFVEPLLFQLLDALYGAIKATEQGEIHIKTEEEGAQYRLYLKTTSLALSAHKVSYLLDRFFSQQGDDQRYVPGLRFCRLALRQIQGDITGKAVEGDGVEFVVTFPR